MQMPGVDSQIRPTEPLTHDRQSSHSPAEDSSARKARPPTAAEAPVALTDPAAHVVTDFVWEQPVTVCEELSIDEALREMIRAGVRALLVVRDEVVTGLITSYDIQGERPLQFLTESGYRRHDEVEVGHIMTPWQRVPTLDWPALGHARISDLAAFFRSTGATHVVMVENTDQGSTAVRGLISRTRLERQLGHSI
jgi:CBS domain-containing protein